MSVDLNAFNDLICVGYGLSCCLQTWVFEHTPVFANATKKIKPGELRLADDFRLKSPATYALMALGGKQSTHLN
jgi:hypothetical protein